MNGGGERLANYQPTDLSFSPDGTCLAYLHAASHQIARQLWGVDGLESAGASLTPRQLVTPPHGQADTEATLSRDEKLRRERQRAYAVGVTSYAWAGPGGRILVPMQGSLYVQDGVRGEKSMRRVYNAKAPRYRRRLRASLSASEMGEGEEEGEFHDANANAVEEEEGEEKEEEEEAGGAIDPQASPDGKWVAFVRRGELYVVPLEEEGLRLLETAARPSSVEEKELEGGALRLTWGADEKKGRTHGLAEFIAQEEMDRFSGFWWAPDSRAIAYCAVDEGAVPPYAIVHQGLETAGEESVEVHRYPFAGGKNARVTLWVVRFEDLEERWAVACKGEKMGPPRLVPTRIDLSPSSSPSDTPAPAPVPMDQEATTSNNNGRRRRRRGEDASNGLAGGEGEGEYVARVHWLPDGCLGVQVQDRRQQRLRLLRVCPRTGQSHLLLEERAPEGLWVNLHDLFKPLRRPILPSLPSSSSAAAAAAAAIEPRRRKRSQEEEEGSEPEAMVLASTTAGDEDGNKGAFSFLWGSERRNGFMHLELYTFLPSSGSPAPQPPAQLIGCLSSGEWAVESIAGVDEERGLVFVTGTHDSPLERHLYALPLLPRPPSSTPPSPRRLTSEAGMHATVKMDGQGRRVATVFSCPDTPAQTRLFSVEAGSDDPSHKREVHELVALRPLAVLHDAMDRRLAAVKSKVAAPHILSFHPRDDPATALYAAVYKPDAAVHGPGPYPSVVSVYGGPHVQKVSRSWALTVDMMAQRLRDMGVVVLKCDNRGSARRGLKFEGALRCAFGTVEVRDQEDAVQLLIAQGLTAPGRVGVYGWSYGGFLACMCLCKAPETFTAGIAGAPVTSWDGYDTHYTERYMGLPQEHPDAYEQGSVLKHVDRLKGRLLLIHGQVDENVHFRHTARLINALISARKPHDLLLFPDGRHSLRKAVDRLYLEQRITDFLVQTLGVRDTKQKTLPHFVRIIDEPVTTATATATASSSKSSNSSSSSAAAGGGVGLPRVPSPRHPPVNAHL